MVGNDLVVGAPGSSLAGPGDGVVYVFDANDEGTTFGELLATLTIPDPGASNEAQFGASVGATNTNILVGAPGKDGGTGAAYEFEGDTTQSNFGELLLDIPNPTSQPGSDFGAAVAADGNDVIVGAPTVDLAGAVGGVFLFDGTTGDPITSIANPDASTTMDFGSAVASVGSDILIGSPDDNDGAGAAFLYAPPATVGTATMLTTFVQPDGGGGNFGASVAGTENTALIGAPGANLGTSDAGAAYLFDADPASPTFGQAIAAVQEPTPTSGDALGTAVGFDDGALIAGAAGVGAVDLYQPTVPLSLSSATTYATASYDSVILSGTFMDANPSVGLTASINWGDGSSATVIDLPVGSYAFSVPHDYTTNPTSGYYTIGVTLTDPAGESTFAQTTLAIDNPAPVFAPPGLVLSSSSIDEGGTVNVSGTIVNPDGSDTDSVTLDWGDGSAPTTIVLPMGQDTFSTTHEYLSNPAGVESENYTIVGSATNQNGQVGYASASVTVNKVAPQFTAADLSLSETNANEGDTITLDGQFTDPDALSSYTVTIDWGDGSTPTVLSELDGQVVLSATPGLYTYSTTHQYLQNPTWRADRGHLRHRRFGVGRCEHRFGRHADRRERRSASGPDPQFRGSGLRDDHRDGRRDGPGPARHRHGGLDAHPEWDRDRDSHGYELHFPDPQPARAAGRDRDRRPAATAAGHRQRADGAHRPVGCFGRDQCERDHGLDRRGWTRPFRRRGRARWSRW